MAGHILERFIIRFFSIGGLGMGAWKFSETWTPRANVQGNEL